MDIPLTVSPGSHKTTAERLIYERIVLNDLYEGNMKDRHKYDINMAFRYNAKDAVLSNFKIKKPKKIVAEAGDIIICNTEHSTVEVKSKVTAREDAYIWNSDQKDFGAECICKSRMQ